MKNTRRVLIMACSLMMLLALILPAGALEQVFASMEAEPLHQAAQITAQPAPQAKAAKKQPTKEEIAAQWATVTSSSTTYAEVPSVTAPYAAGSLTDAFLETGVTYLNYVRFVAGLPAVTLDPTLNADSQHGAVLLAAIDELTHYPSQPKDMEDAFYQRGSAATQSANISARWGYRDQTTMLKSAVEGCMNDNNSLENLSTAGHRRWFLNPTLGKVGFGYAQSVEKWSYIVTKVFDRSGAGCDFDFISWPAEGNHPTNLFNAKDPWTVTLNTSVYKTASVKALQVTITRESDGKQWVLDASTGSPNLDSEDNIKPYLTVENSYYGLPNCIIFHPGSDAVAKYEGIYTVKITGLVTSKGKAAELNYTVDFFDINSVSCAHTYNYTVTKAPTVAESGLLTGSCSKCSGTTTVTLPKLNTTDYSYTVTKAATCTADGTGRYTWKTTTYGSFSFDVIISKACHSYTAVTTDPTCQGGGYTTYTCSRCGDSYVSDYTGSVDHHYEDGGCIWCGKAEKDYTITWKGVCASLGGNIALVFGADLSEDLANDPNAFVRYTYHGKTYDVPVSDAIYNGEFYEFYFRITSVNMTDMVEAQMMVGDLEIGSPYSRSLEDYCVKIIKKNAKPKSVALMKAMLNYGAAAQVLNNYKTDTLANRYLDDADKILTAVDATAYRFNMRGSEEGIEAVGKQLLLGSETTIRIGFRLAEGKTADEYTFTIDGKEAKPVYKDGLYCLEVPNISAHKLDEFHTFTCGGITLEYCALSYVNSMMNKYTEGPSFDLAVAIYNYSQATEAYIAK